MSVLEIKENKNFVKLDVEGALRELTAQLEEAEKYSNDEGTDVEIFFQRLKKN
jgi:hypothetical protein